MQNEIGGWEVARNRKARVHSVAVEQKLIVIPTKAGADGPIAEANEILHVSGLLEIRMISRERESERSARIELARIHGDIRNDVVEILVQKSIVGLDARFP